MLTYVAGSNGAGSAACSGGIVEAGYAADAAYTVLERHSHDSGI